MGEWLLVSLYVVVPADLGLGAYLSWSARRRHLAYRVGGFLPDARIQRGALFATLKLERDVEVTLRPERGGLTWRLSAPVARLRRHPRFTTSDAQDARTPFFSVLNPLFSSWDTQAVYGVEGALVLEARESRSRPDEETLQEQAERLIELARELESRDFGGELECPGCRSMLSADKGALHEAVCPACRGRFLPRDAVERLVGAELGKSAGELKEAALGTKRTGECPSCGHHMSPVLVEDEIVALCTGCGGMWLDEGELDALSGGRYAETR